MKFLNAAVAFNLLAASNISAMDSTDKTKQICVESPVKECYPKVFEPTKKWQTVKKGQDIPGGM